MKLLIDMNLSPRLLDILKDAGYEVAHWSNVGDPRASDAKILEWALDNEYIVITHDLDFGNILAATNANYPSVLQVRTQNVSPEYIKNPIFSALRQYGKRLEAGALISIDEESSRVRMLPLRRQ